MICIPQTLLENRAARNLVTRMLIVPTLLLVSQPPTLAQPTLVGKQSCSAATCHGGIVGRGPAWHSSSHAFDARDPHAAAGHALVSPLGRAIVERLSPELRTLKNSQQREALARDITVSRCASCHATFDPREKAADLDFQRMVFDGVSCESCHGAAADWLHAHLSESWNSEQAQATGMRDTASWLKRIDGCVRCHVGSRTADGMVRDMNHDMIAAGHPPLRFDMMLYLEMLPKHWAFRPDGSSVPVESAHKAAVVSTLGAAARLSLERRSAAAMDGAVPHPEFSDYDCYACHHSIQVTRMQRKGKPQWNPWYMSAYYSANIWQIRDPTEAAKLQSIVANAGRIAVDAMQEQSPRMATVGTMELRDWMDVATWWTQNLPFAMTSEFANPIPVDSRAPYRRRMADFYRKWIAFPTSDSPSQYASTSPILLTGELREQIRVEQRELAALREQSAPTPARDE